MGRGPMLSSAMTEGNSISFLVSHAVFVSVRRTYFFNIIVALGFKTAVQKILDKLSKYLAMRGLACVVVLFIINAAGNAAARSKSKMPNQPIKVYYLPPSPPCRSIIMAAKVMGVELDLVLTNIMEGQHMTPEYLKMNPQHTIPTMDDNGFILWESRAILTYLANAYGRDDALYPKNPRLRAIVDQRLNFDLGTLYSRYTALYLPVLFHGADYDEEKAAKLDEALGWLNMFLDGKAFVAGDDLTIADISVIVTITNLDAFGYDMSAHENLTKWFERVKKALEPYGYNEVDAAGAQILASFIKKD